MAYMRLSPTLVKQTQKFGEKNPGFGDHQLKNKRSITFVGGTPIFHTVKD
jgi:hypothetical protein